MKSPPLRAVAVLLALLCASTVKSQTLPSGDYRVVTELGAVLLDGRYPFTLSEMPALLDLTTSPNGSISGTALVLGVPINVQGQIIATAKKVRLSLRGQLGSKDFFLVAKQQAGDFVGTATVGDIRVPIRISLVGTGTVRPSYTLSLAVKPSGDISGSGTLSLGRQEIPVRAIGHVEKGRVSLSITGAKTFLKTKTGQVDESGFLAAKWSAQSFGALMKGRALKFARE